MASIFLCHSSRDKFFVRELAERLKTFKVKVWLDEAEINIGDSLTEKIGQAIDATDFVGVVLSHNSVNSEWVQKELQVAIQKEFANRRVVVLPLLLEAVQIPPFLRDKLYADFTTPEKYEVQFPKLLKALGIPIKEIFVQDKGQAKEYIRVNVKEKQPQPNVKLTPLELRLSKFEDISIVDMDDNKSYKPDPNIALYNIYLRLSSNPPQEWQQIFDAERRFPRHTMWRRAWIEGQHIIVYCVPDELEKYHLRDLRQDVSKANMKYRQYLTELVHHELKDIKKEKDERDQLSDLKRRIKFD